MFSNVSEILKTFVQLRSQLTSAHRVLCKSVTLFFVHAELRNKHTELSFDIFDADTVPSLSPGSVSPGDMLAVC